MGKRRRRSSRDSFWMQQYGGMPVWGLVAALAAVVGIFATFALTSQDSTAAPDPQRTARTEFSFGPGSAAPTPSPSGLPALNLPQAGDDVYIIGDSWSTGYSADADRGYTDLLAESTGWDLTIEAQSGTGYLAVLASTGEPFTARVDELPAASPSMIIVQGGLNDTGESTRGGVADAARQLVGELREKYPAAQIVLVGPATATWPVPSGNVAVDDALASVAAQDGVFYVSPIDEQWVTAENIDTFIDPATAHPSNEGHAEFAARLDAALRDLAG